MTIRLRKFKRKVLQNVVIKIIHLSIKIDPLSDRKFSL